MMAAKITVFTAVFLTVVLQCCFAIQEKQCYHFPGAVEFSQINQRQAVPGQNAQNPFALLTQQTADEQQRQLPGSQFFSSNLPSWFGIPFTKLGASGAAAEDDSKLEWQLRVPGHTVRASVGRINDTGLNMQFTLNSTDLADPRLVKHVWITDPTPGFEAHYAKLINLTSREIKENEWYAVCLELHALEDDHTEDMTNANATGSASDICTRCTVLKTVPSANAYGQRFLQTSWLLDDRHPGMDNAILKYTVADMPVSAAKLFGKIFDPRNESVEPYTFERSIEKNQLVYIDVHGFKNCALGYYVLRTDVHMGWIGDKGNSSDEIPMQKSLILTDYLRQQYTEGRSGNGALPLFPYVLTPAQANAVAP